MSSWLRTRDTFPDDSSSSSDQQCQTMYISLHIQLHRLEYPISSGTDTWHVLTYMHSYTHDYKEY